LPPFFPIVRDPSQPLGMLTPPALIAWSCPWMDAAICAGSACGSSSGVACAGAMGGAPAGQPDCRSSSRDSACLSMKLGPMPLIARRSASVRGLRRTISKSVAFGATV